MIEFPDHTREQMRDRGVSEEEVEEVLARGRPSEVREPRLGLEMVFTEGYPWMGLYYPHKRVKVVFVREKDKVVIVTVYTFCGRWEVEE